MNDQPVNDTPGSSGTQLDSFRPVEGGGQETTSAATFMTVAYAVMWIAAIAFVALTYRRQRALQDRVNHLEAALKKRQS